MLWLLEQAPPYLPYLLYAVGFLALVVAIVVDLLAKYRVLVISVCISMLMAASWLVGANEIRHIFATKLLEARVDVMKAEIAAANISAKTEFVYVDKIQKVRDTQIVIQEKIRDVAITVDENCKISPEIVNIHNKATERPQ